jgi:hypothetical protein
VGRIVCICGEKSYFVLNANMKTPTACPDFAELQNYERSVLKCDVCGTEIPVPLQEETPGNVIFSDPGL